MKKVFDGLNHFTYTFGAHEYARYIATIQRAKKYGYKVESIFINNGYGCEVTVPKEFKKMSSKTY